MKIRFLGAVGTVTGSKFELYHHGFKFLIDCGLYQGPRELRELNFTSLEGSPSYNAVVLTHAHIDHSGYLPRLVRDGFYKNIYCTPATYELCKILLMDAAKLQEEDAEFANRTRHSRHYPAEPLYTSEDALVTLELFRTCAYHEWISLHPSISIRFIRSGHILGSALVQVQYVENEKSKIITFTGDLGGGRSQVIRDPESIIETDFLVSESTYGNRNLKPLDEDELASIITKVFKRQGTLIIPAFSVGRTQEILFLIKKLQNENKISTHMPTYLDSPMATRASEVYKKFPDELKIFDEPQKSQNFFLPLNFRVCESSDESLLLCMSDQPKIVISASGMLQGGRVLHHLRAKLGDPKSAVLFTGYQGKGTKGLLLKDGLKKIRIHHKEIDVEAEIFALDMLSAHADSDELMRWYRGLEKPPQKTFLVHGEAESQGALQYRIKNELGWECIVPVDSTEFDLNS